MNNLTRALFLAGLLGVHAAFALDPDRHITELMHRSWGAREGAPTDVIGLAQTIDGYIWLAGRSGLYRFDGLHFQLFEPRSGPKFLSRDILSVFASRDGTLWIGYRNGGVSALRSGTLTNYVSVNGFPDGRVNGFAQDREGKVWAASSRGLACFDGARWRALGSEANFPGTNARAVFVDHLGALWGVGEHRIAVLSPGSSRFELADEPYNGFVRQLAESPDGTMWMPETTRAVRPLARPGQASPFHGLSRADCQSRFPDTWQTEHRCQRPDDLEVRVGSRAVLFDSNGSLWITTLGDGLRRAAYPSRLHKAPIGEFDTVLEQFTSKDGLSADYVTNILEDREGDIWVSTSQGIDQFRASVLAPIDLGPDSGGYSMAPGDNGYIFVAAGERVLRFRDGHEKPVVVIADAGTATLHRDPLGSIWSADLAGACRITEHACIEEVGLPAGRRGPSADFWRFAMDETHRGWAYMLNDGLFVREDTHWRRVSDAPTGAAAYTQFTDSSGQIWFGLSTGQLVSVKSGHVHTYSSDAGLAVGGVKAIASLGARVWVGGENGVALLRDSRFTSVIPADADAFESVSGVAEAGDGSLWLVEYRGVIRIPAAEVARVLQSPPYRVHYEVLNYFDGLPGETQGAIRLPAAIRGTDGRLWFAAAHGVAWVNPNQLYRNRLPPPVSIETVVADGRLLMPSATVELPGRTANLQVAYSGLSFSVPERVQFRYRLSGFDREWQNVGTRRTAYYSRLPPGTYSFQVTASNNDGVWNDVGAELGIHILPAWYQTFWFRAACVTALAALLWGAYWLRVRHLARAFENSLEARVAERTRIARELHDTLLQSFQGLLMRFQVAYELLPARPTEAKQDLGGAIDRTVEAINEGRNAVQGLRSSAVEDDDLGAAIKTLAEELAGGDYGEDVVFHIDVQGTGRPLHPLVHDEIYQIAAEALRNSRRHAHASKIEVELCYDERQLRLRIRDNGRGIEPKFLDAGGRTGHYGLRGMRERAELIGGKLTIWTAADSGTELELRVPAARAYAATPPGRLRWLPKRFSRKNLRDEA